MNKILWEKYNPYPTDTKPDDMLEYSNMQDVQFKFISPTESMNQHIMSDFNFWCGHTNFVITGEVSQVLDNIDGVEALEFVTPYRFIIGIGKAFDEDEVKVHIEQSLNCDNVMLDQAVATKLEAIKLKLRDKQWVIYVLPNGEIDYTYSQSKSFDKKMGLFLEAREACGGLILTNEKK